jgi:hypothetical protein
MTFRYGDYVLLCACTHTGSCMYCQLGGVCDQKISRFFASCEEECIAGHVGVKEFIKI